MNIGIHAWSLGFECVWPGFGVGREDMLDFQTAYFTERIRTAETDPCTINNPARPKSLVKIGWTPSGRLTLWSNIDQTYHVSSIQPPVAQLMAGARAFVEFRIGRRPDLDASSTSYGEVRINGVTVFPAFPLDFAPGKDDCAGLRYHFSVLVVNGITFIARYLDADEQDAPPFHGWGSAQAQPLGRDDVTGWTPSAAGAHYLLLQTDDGDQSTVSASAPGRSERVGLATAPGAAAAPAITAVVRGDLPVQMVASLDGQEVARGPAIAAGGQDWLTRTLFLPELNPTTQLPWTAAELGRLSFGLDTTSVES